VYFTVQAGLSDVKYTNSNLSNGITARRIKTSGVNYHIGSGYQFNRWLAAEFGIIWVYKPQFLDLNGTSKDAKIKNNVVYLAARVGWPVWRFLFYVKGGIGYIARQGFFFNKTRALSEGSFFTTIYGAGFLFHFTSHWGADVSWMQAPPNRHQQIPTTNFYGAGIVYSFKP